MPKINVLTREVAELIAAGEVIERPASVIKELAENSVDSGAKHITVEIKHGGTTYMRVTDDGCGIAYEDVPNAFLRHATSKIISADDLGNICTFGFRGEALASVSAVSKTEIKTKQKFDAYGTYYKICGSIQQDYEHDGCSDGTSVTVKDLFYNVPARQKFMKKDVAEGNAVSNIISKIAISHPDISFKFIRDGKTEFATTGDGELYSAIYAVYGKAFAKDMIPVSYCDNGITVSGFTVKPLYSKSNRSFQNFFINSRYIKSSVCTAALEEAYKGMIMTGKFPLCVLMIDIPPSTVDVNAHPAKMEVRFSDEKRVFECVMFAVKDALYKSGFIYEFQIKSDMKEYADSERIQNTDNPNDDNIFRNNIPEHKNSEDKRKEKINIGLENFVSMAKHSDIPDISPNGIDLQEKAEKISEPEKNIQKPETAVHENFRYINNSSFERKKAEPVCDAEEVYMDLQNGEKQNIHVIGEIFANYIIAETDDKMVMFDKHAGHERIIYEQLKARNKIMESQYMLDGIDVLVPESEFETLRENYSLFENSGFELDFSNPPCITAKAVPVFLDISLVDEAIEEIAHNLYLNKTNLQPEVIDDIFHGLACKSAVRANDKNSLQELQSLAEQIYFNENIRHCPHGRPVMFILTKREFEKQFKRIQ
jgi:DNA mismatch repair protein MutL